MLHRPASGSDERGLWEPAGAFGFVSLSPLALRSCLGSIDEFSDIFEPRLSRARTTAFAARSALTRDQPRVSASFSGRLQRGKVEKSGGGTVESYNHDPSPFPPLPPIAFANLRAII
jgi:hypothetical protein